LPALILPTGGAGGPDVLVYTYDTLQDTRFLSYILGGTQSVRWPSDPLGEDSYRAALAVDDTKVLAVVKTRVFALDRQSGSLAWEASISDEIPYSCPDDCLMVVGQRVVVLSRDGRLAGFDAQSGQTVWNTRLNSTPDQLYAVNGQLAVFDNRDGAVVLLVIDPVDGSEQETLTPECTDPSSGFVDDPGFNSQVLVTPDQRSLVLLFGFFSSCVQRWDIASGSMAWNASLGDVAFSHAFGPTSIISGDSVYVAGDNQLLTVGLTDGIWTVLTDDPDYELVPLGTRDGVLITRAKRTRGSTRFELWGLEMSTGRQVWQHPLPDSEPLDEPDRMSGLIDKGDSAWTAHLTAEGLVVVTAMAEPHQLTVETLDPATGTSAGATPIPLAGITGGFYAVPDVVAWVDDQLWLIVEGRVYAVSPAQGALEFKWP
jgi:outer membrane protein assembly factor BamB